MSRCNFCLLRDFERVAAKTHGALITQPAPAEGFPDGVDVLIRYGRDGEFVWAAWFAKLTDHCVC